MKKILLFLSVLASTGFAATAQLSQGGLPLGIRNNADAPYVPVSSYPLPDWNNGLKKWESDQAKGISKPYLIALYAPTDIGFPNSGTFTTLENGQKIWRAQVKIENAKGLGFLYDHFQLPKGVQYYISNENNMQILGAFTNENNDATQKFVTEAVQGDVVNLEMDIDATVNLTDIKMHINNAAVYFRGIDYLANYIKPESINHFWDAKDSMLTGGTSICMINAICPIANNYAAQRNAAFEMVLFGNGGAGICSATMINTADNKPGSCKQYCLLASHCEMTNATAGGFDQSIFRFNFQQATCNPAAGTIPNTTKTLVGANFVARSIFPNANPQNVNGDFLLLESKTAIPAEWNVNLAGWNRDASISTTATQPEKFICFHHPHGDVKKVTTFSSLQLNSTGMGTDNYWVGTADSGLAGPGSSGSGLFDGQGRLIGDLSLGGGTAPAGCDVNALGQGGLEVGTSVLYSTLANNWDYSTDGTSNTSKLKPWLDPGNTDVLTTNTVTSTCTAVSTVTSIKHTNEALEDAISIFPNPSLTGNTTIRINLKDEANLTATLYDITGKRLAAYSMKNIKSGNYMLDLSNYSNGIYLLKISDGNSVISKKIMLDK